ncbi:MAG: hypothetical protein ACFE9Z_14895 [Promethearchaeota archaeon]
MDKERILREAQKIARNYSFWMVSGNISHLYGYVYEDNEQKYELEIKFDENFPNSPPKLIFHKEINDLLGDFQLNSLENWNSNSNVIKIVDELKKKIISLIEPKGSNLENNIEFVEADKPFQDSINNEEYITPDLNAYPPDFTYDDLIETSETSDNSNYTDKPDIIQLDENESSNHIGTFHSQEMVEEPKNLGVAINTELSLIQQEYAYDQPDSNNALINVYLTITITKTFIISIDFMNYPQKPIISFPEEVTYILGDANQSLTIIKNWDAKKPVHVVDILHELEKRLLIIKEIETQSKKLTGEYQCENVPNNLTVLRVHLLTYGFKEYIIEVDLEPFPKPPLINLTPELKKIIQKPITELNTYKNWEENETEPVDIIREISWLVDKNSRINFEIDLLKDHYKNIRYESSTAMLYLEMKGKMRTEDLTFEFQVNLPREYPMKMPEVKVINKFELEAHEKIKNDLHNSFNDFFDEWSPFSYLVDLFNLISKKIFEVSVVSCVICHKIECPSCTKKIAGEDNCHAECPHCNRAYHKHCWEQTIKSFGKCGFCLR